MIDKGGPLPHHLLPVHCTVVSVWSAHTSITLCGPGIVITEVYETIAQQLGRDLEDLMNELSTTHPLGRVSTAEEQVTKSTQNVEKEMLSSMLQMFSVPDACICDIADTITQ